MLKNVFSVRDSKAEVFDFPASAHTIAEAERMFTTLANNQETPIGKFPEDYDLYHLGKYDTATGKFELFPSPQHIVKAVNLVNKIN